MIAAIVLSLASRGGSLPRRSTLTVGAKIIAGNIGLPSKPRHVSDETIARQCADARA